MLRAGARAAVDAVSELAVEELKIETGTQGPPRSLPGGAPHMDTTELNLSIRKQNYSESGVEGAVIGEDTPYALALEFGNPESNLAPRPHQTTEFNKLQNDARYTNLAAQKVTEATHAGS